MHLYSKYPAFYYAIAVNSALYGVRSNVTRDHLNKDLFEAADGLTSGHFRVTLCIQSFTTPLQNPD